MRPLILFLIVCALLPVSPVAADGGLRYAGATTLARYFMPEAARLFAAQTGIHVSVLGGNTGPGLEALRSGNVDLAGSGRFLSDAEKETGLVETLVGWDVMTVVVHESNPVASLSQEQLRGLFSGRIVNWQEVGGREETVVVVSSPRGSGMRAAVAEEILKGLPFSPREVVAPVVADTDRQVALLPVAIAAVSKCMVDAPGVKTVEVDGITPTLRAVATRRYPLVKPLLLVTVGPPRGDVVRFIDFVLGAAGQELMAREFYPLN